MPVNTYLKGLNVKTIQFKNEGQVSVMELVKDNPSEGENQFILRMIVKRGGIEVLVDLTDTEVKELVTIVLETLK